MNLIIYWCYIIIAFLMSFIPGFVIAGRFKSLSVLEKLSISFGCSYVIIVMLVPFFAFKLNFIAQLIFIYIMIASLWYLLKKRLQLKFEIDSRFIIMILIIGLISKFFLQTLWEYPVMGGDWFWHTFRIPYAFEQGDWTPPTDRPPLFNLLIYSYHNLLGTSLYQYWISQIISVVINSVYIFPAYLIAKKAFGDRVAKISALFMLVTPFLIFNTLYTWPKNAAMYGILMMIYFLFFSEYDIKLRYPLAGFFAGLGFWFHNYAVFYIAIAVLLLIYKEKMYKGLISRNIFNNLKKLSYFLIVLLIVLAPYFLWVYSYYGTISTSKFIYYPFAVKGYDSALSGDTQELFNTFYSTPVKEIIMIRISNAIVTLTPAALPINPIAASFSTYNPIFYYSHDYPGALSTLMYLVVVILFFKYLLGKTKINLVLAGFVVLPIFIYLILYGWREWGLLTGGLHPTIPLLIILGFNELYKSYNRLTGKILVFLVFLVAIIDNIIYFNIIKKFYYIEGGLRNVADSLHQVVPNADVSNLISAYFLLNTEMDVILNLIITISVSLFAYYLLMLRDV
ncbi:Dolichyl-phosphate-mannose-protein mannosyltransferase [uncultured archaeon]|nr:Dolichyl-phosphate-mannose-protein mannosyltransferase [uncultured archaeon]